VHRFLTVVILLSHSLHAADRIEGRKEKKKESAFEGITKLLPPGSELQGVILPRYDENRRLTGTVKTKVMRLVDADTMSGEEIRIEFFNDDRTESGRADLENALLHSDRGMIESWSPVSLDSESLHARGSGLVLDFGKSEGVLLGPLRTWAPSNNQPIAMNSKSKSLRAAGLAGAALVSQTMAEPAAPVSPATSAPPVSAETAKKDMADALEQSNAANAKAKAFLENAGLGSADSKAPEEPAAKPLDIQPGPDDMQIDCDGGMHFNSNEGVFVYMKNVRVEDPRFKMTGANELKIFLEKLPQDQAEVKKEEKDKGDLGISRKFGKVERVLATGAIQIDQKSVNGKEPIKASGAVFNYNIKQDLVTVSGGYPWVVQGGLALRAEEPNLMLTILPKAGEFRTEGKWKTIIPVKELQDKDKKKEDAKPN
jgi:lipopolysaccharide export system protein LptA